MLASLRMTMDRDERSLEIKTAISTGDNSLNPLERNDAFMSEIEEGDLSHILPCIEQFIKVKANEYNPSSGIQLY